MVIELEQALEIVRSVPFGSGVQTVALDEALGRVLACEVVSPIDSPPFDKSAMDGFAVGGVGAAEYRILQTVAAGGAPVRAVGTGECARIMTGAVLPREPIGSFARSMRRKGWGSSVLPLLSRATT